MAKRRSRRGAYRMTPARRAALHKAQLASARRRRKASLIHGAKVVGTIAGGIATTAAVYHVQRFANHPIKTSQEARANFHTAKGWITGKRGSDPNAPKMPARKPIGYYKRSARVAHRSAGIKTRSRVAGRLR